MHPNQRLNSQDLSVLNTLNEKHKTEYLLNRNLCISCEQGHLDLAKKFIYMGASNVNAALLFASMSGNMRLVEYLINIGADNWNDGLFGAAEKGNGRMMKYFIEKGANNYETAKHCSSRTGNIDLYNSICPKTQTLNLR